jgi:hypothetical protein
MWRPIPSLPDYLASSLGRIMRVPFIGEMPHGGPRAYGGTPTFGVLNEGRYQLTYKGRMYKVHRLVCEAFAGPSPFPGAVVMHMDEDATNNAASNLRWGTQRENLAAPGFRAYLRRRSCKPKINREQAAIIKYSGRPCAQLAREFGISPATVSNIRAGRSWKHI